MNTKFPESDGFANGYADGKQGVTTLRINNGKIYTPQGLIYAINHAPVDIRKYAFGYQDGQHLALVEDKKIN